MVLVVLAAGALWQVRGNAPGVSPGARSVPPPSAVLAVASIGIDPPPGPRAPELPRVYLDTTAGAPTGRVISVTPDSRREAALNASRRLLRVSAGGRLQTALDAARPGDVIELLAGSAYVGNFVLPDKVGTEWITIRSSEHTRLPPPGSRVSPAAAGRMPTIVSPNIFPAIRTAPNAHHYRLVGIELATTWATTRGQIHTVVDLSGGSDITIDRCYIHGTPTGNVRHGVVANGASLAVIDSYISDIHHLVPGYDAAAIWAWNGPGPFKIVNNYLEASAVNLFFGGEGPTVPNLVPSDIEIRGNYLFKPLSWRAGDPTFGGIAWNVKNLFELKNARRVLVEGNVFENSWAQTQGGFAVVFTPRNQNGTAPWSAVEDVTFVRNIIRRSTAGLNLLGWDDIESVRTPLQRVLIRDNLLLEIGAFPDTAYQGTFTGVLFLIQDGPRDLVIDHNTGIQTDSPILVATQASGRWPAVHFVFTNNIAPSVRNVREVEPRTPLDLLATYFPGYVFARNALVGGNPLAYPPENFFPASLGAVGLVNPAAGDYRLAAGSPYRGQGTDGKDLGADLSAIAAAIPSWLQIRTRP